MKSGICLLVCLAFITGCGVSKLKPVDTSLQESYLSFIQDGKTTKEDIIQKYGNHCKTFTNDSIRIYIMQLDGMKGFITDVGWREEYHFVFVFDEHNVLKKHSFLKAR